VHINHIEDAGGDLKYDFLQEINVMKKVAEGSNPFVVNMVGCSTTNEPLALVMEFVPRGNLLEFLKGYRRKVCIFLKHGMSWEYFLHIPVCSLHKN